MKKSDSIIRISFNNTGCFEARNLIYSIVLIGLNDQKLSYKIKLSCQILNYKI